MSNPFNLHDGLGYRLTIAARTNNAVFDAKLSDLGLTRQMWCVLVAVGEQGIDTPSAIADYIGIIRPAASRTLKQMEKSGLLARASGQGDKRTTQVALTQDGKRRLARSLPLAAQNRADLNAVLTTTEQATLVALLEKLTKSAATTASGV
ncbi:MULTISPECIES: MarR family transcriptional regulator [Rhodobacterales]|uniref:MarR family winged helix-turn-helix transcriptional regulator n=1 Tax=Roseobacter sp. N2S TaxID=2663844 RepID=UPI0028611A25|nr:MULTISPECIES: MarR family transcriptional regulator [Rhodobacterales]MDR6265213.1 DNA-binding MarR family transcriptional regulator [Roseobacter sp. N2S]